MPRQSYHNLLDAPYNSGTFPREKNSDFGMKSDTTRFRLIIHGRRKSVPTHHYRTGLVAGRRYFRRGSHARHAVGCVGVEYRRQ